jgi:SPP1 family predicted phage head-tail adaptor
VKCCSDITAGMLSTPVQFQRMSRVSDGAGGFSQAWLPLAGTPTRAHVKSMSGSERYASARIEATATHRVTVRYFAGLTEADSVVFAGKRSNIRFINNLEQRDRWLVLDVQTGVAPA